MAKPGTQYIKIKIKTETGEVVKIKDEKGVEATAVGADEVEQVRQDPNTTDVATILHTHQSPACVYILLAGRYYKICW